MKNKYFKFISWVGGLAISLLGWFIIIYTIVQLYFWFNPSPSPFWFFTIFNQGA